jgi:hypothetical protein
LERSGNPVFSGILPKINARALQALAPREKSSIQKPVSSTKWHLLEII